MLQILFALLGLRYTDESLRPRRAKPKSAKRLRACLNRKSPKMTANTVTLTWVDPTELVDGLPLPAGSTVAAFDSGSPTPSVALGTVAVGVQTFTTAVLAPGLHNFTVVVTDPAGVSSVPSNVASVTVPTPVDMSPPDPATGLVAVLNTQ